jgi:hypothetical protein
MTHEVLVYVLVVFLKTLTKVEDAKLLEKLSGVSKLQSYIDLCLYGRVTYLRLSYLESWTRMRSVIIHILIDDSSAQGGDKKSYSVGEDISNMCKQT